MGFFEAHWADSSRVRFVMGPFCASFDQIIVQITSDSTTTTTIVPDFHVQVKAEAKVTVEVKVNE